MGMELGGENWLGEDVLSEGVRCIVVALGNG